MTKFHMKRPKIIYFFINIKVAGIKLTFSYGWRKFGKLTSAYSMWHIPNSQKKSINDSCFHKHERNNTMDYLTA